MATMRAVAEKSDPRCLNDNPIDVLEAMAQSDEYIYSPLAFCYINYSSRFHTGHALQFGSVPRFDANDELHGSLLGGAGLAISAYSTNVDAALEYALYVSSPEIQRGLYVRSGGQPAHAAAWRDLNADEYSGGFFSTVLPTLESSWTRPTAPRFAEFQNHMIQHFGNWFEAAIDVDVFLDQLDALYCDIGLEHGLLSLPES